MLQFSWTAEEELRNLQEEKPAWPSVCSDDLLNFELPHHSRELGLR